MTLDSLDPKYRLILCDVWGVIHDGIAILPGVIERLRRWRGEGRTVILLTNAPRTVESVAGQLERIGLPSECWDHIATSGEAGIAALGALGAPVGFIGTASEREVLKSRGIVIADDESFTDLACTGIDENRRSVAEYAAELEALAERDVRMHCLNPDRVVHRGGIPEPCAGAIADAFAMMGGDVTWYGKPFPAIYDHALRLGGNPPKDEVVAVGDGLQTDILGAARCGIDAIFVTSGIHRGEAFPDDFGVANGLGDWQPVAVVDGLA